MEGSVQKLLDLARKRAENGDVDSAVSALEDAIFLIGKLQAVGRVIDTTLVQDVNNLYELLCREMS